jgi:hypothetical protein
VSQFPARVGSLLFRRLSAEGVQVLTPLSQKRSWNGSGSVSALGCGSVGQSDQRGRESGADSCAEGERDSAKVHQPTQTTGTQHGSSSLTPHAYFLSDLSQAHE